MSSRLLVGRYELIEKIGEGGMAVVYKAKDRLLNRYVAIKILRPEFARDDKFLENFKKESQAAAGLSHPNIVNVYDVGKEGNIHFIVMELIDGKPLSNIIEEKGRIEYREVISIIKQVASALSLAHRNGIIHRDVKPHNILITSTGTAKLADFGIAMAVSKESIAEGKEKIMGSVHYFSPEQARGAYVDERSDLYSLGIVIYEMLTGKVPFDGDNPISIALMHINEEIPSVSRQVSGIPPQLEKVIEKATDKYQSKRYKSADEMIEDLDNIDFISKVMGSAMFVDASVSKNGELRNGNGFGDGSGYDSDHRAGYGGVRDGRRDFDDERSLEDRRGVDGKKGSDDKNSAKQPMSKGRIFVIVASVIVLLAGIIGIGAMAGWFSGAGDEIVVPDFTGKTFEDAVKMAEDLKLTVEKGQEVFSPDKEEGLITSQSPSKGSKVSQGKVITVNISLGKKDGVVPSLVDMDYKKAEKYLESLGFQLGLVVKVTSTKPENTIISQSIEAGSTADSGTRIDIEISDGKGKKMAKVPSLVGKNVDDAKTEILAAGFKVGYIDFAESASYEKNLVIDQQYKEGSELEEGSSIDLVISKGIQNSSGSTGGEGGEGSEDGQGGQGSSEGGSGEGTGGEAGSGEAGGSPE